MSNAVRGSAINEEVGLVLENVHHIALGLRQIDPMEISQDRNSTSREAAAFSSPVRERGSESLQEPERRRCDTVRYQL
jgi:hypothetical protein